MQPDLGSALGREQNLAAMRARIRVTGLGTASVRSAAVLAWSTLVLHAVLMIVLSWRWAFNGESHSLPGAVTLSALMLGFVGAAATIVDTLGRPAKTRASSGEGQADALLLFPAEDATDSDRVFTSHSLATRRKALL